MTSTGSQPPAGGLRTIVVGYDGTSPAERALARAAELARAFGSTVIVADVAAPAPVEAMPGAFGLTPYLTTTPENELRVDEAMWQQHRGRVESFFADTGIAHEFDGVVGDPAAEIVDVAERRNADLIVVGTREPGLLDRLLAGSVSQGVARRARCDVLIVHPQLDD
ncbi:MAG TPA: universal stress protein [Gaiellaceae bacterium]|nr:universal stress protein [Gaiellaceae bacterium]